MRYRTRSCQYLALLPALLTQVGVIRDGVPIAHGEMRNRLRRRSSRSRSYYSTNPHTGVWSW
jgi:hypothetical protein